MRRLTGPALVLLLTLALVASGDSVASADLGGFVIKEFATDIEIQANSDLLVAEEVTVDFSGPRHGIYRTIPYSYTDPKGYRYSFGFRLLEVVDENGRAFGTKISKSGSYYEVRIGDPDRMVEGRVVYRIRYRVERALGRFAKHDELYWNATGNEWQTTIESARTRVRLPAPFTTDSLEVAGYTGRFGSREGSVRVSFPGPGEVEFETTRELRSLEGLTVAVAWPSGHVEHPSAVGRAARAARDNWVILTPFLWLAFLLRRYRSQGRDPAGEGSIMVQYEPPTGLTPAELGTIIDENVNLEDITATVVDLAVRGLLTIREEEQSSLFGLIHRSEIVFERAGDAETFKLLPHERKVFDGIFQHGTVVGAKDLKQKFYREIGGIRKSVYERLVELGSFHQSPRSVRRRWFLFGVLAGLLTLAVGILTAKVVGAIFPNALLVPLIAAVSSMLLFFAFSPAMPRRTKKGVAEREWAVGFQEFVTRTDADRIERELAEFPDPVDARNAFERLLPFAMALGVGSAWAKRFQSLYTYESSPAWYVGSGHAGGFSPVSLEQSLTQSMASVGQNMASTPRSSGSSGSGGGGFSGGGGGGGGGGSW